VWTVFANVLFFIFSITAHINTAFHQSQFHPSLRLIC